MPITINGSGTITPSSAVQPAGSILQVVSTTKTDTFSASITTGSQTAEVPGLTATITPSATSSKILVLYAVSVGQDTPYMILQRGGSALTAATGDAAGSRTRMTLGAVNFNDSYTENISGQFLDSPSSTSALTYGMKFKHGSSSTKTLRINYDNADADDAKRARAISTITLMEISG